MACKHAGIAEQMACPLCSTPCPSFPHVATEADDTKTERMAFLERMKETTKADLLMKFGNGDWHGVQDCGSDLRDIDSELAGLNF